jgi:hypothetical protein
MITTYRLLIKIQIEGEEPPTEQEVAEEIARLIRDENDHNLDVKVSAIKLS